MLGTFSLELSLGSRDCWSSQESQTVLAPQQILLIFLQQSTNFHGIGHGVRSSVNTTMATALLIWLHLIPVMSMKLGF